MSRRRPSYAQSRALLDHVERHPQLARGRQQNEDARRRANLLWKEITLKLNAMGDCVKDTATWKKYWNDKKTNAKKRTAVQIRAVRSTGGVVSTLPPHPSELDKRILKLIGSKFGSKIPGVACAPFPSQTTGGVVSKLPDPSELDKRIIKLLGEEFSSEIAGIAGLPLRSQLAEDEGSSGATSTSSMVPTQMEDENDCEEKPTVDIGSDPLGNSTATDSAQLNTADSAEPNTADSAEPNTASGRRSRFRSALGDVSDYLVAMEERCVDGEGRLAQDVHNLCSYLIATRHQAGEVARAQIAAARAQQEAAEAQSRVAHGQADAARAQLEAAQALIEAAGALVETIRGPR